ncbi:MAG: MBL fold metallo-hydrolase, partial [Gemmatimonadales bacterium]
MRLTFLGTGTSFGVPQIGCGCAVCRSTDPRDKRTRSGAILEAAGSTILIDTPPELRLQLIAGGFSTIDAVVYTHEHADHINGIDDLRIFSVRRHRPLPVDGPAETLERLRLSFNSHFDDAVPPYEGTSTPTLE